MNKGVIAHSLNSIRYYLNRSQKFSAVGMLILLLITSFLDVVGLAALVPVMTVAAEPGGVQKSKIFAPVYHALHFESERTFLVVVIVAVLLYFLFKNLFSTWVNYLQMDFTAKLGLDIIKRQLNKYLHFPFWDFNHLGSGTLIHNSIDIPRHYVSMVLRPLFALFSEVAVMTVIVLSMLIYKPMLLGLLAVALVPSTLLTYRVLRGRTQAIGARMNSLSPFSYGIIHDLFTGFVELKLAHKQYHFRDRLLVIQAELQVLDSKSYLYSLLPLKVIEMVAILGMLLIFLYAIFVPSNSSLITLVGLFAAAAYRLMPSVNRMLTAMMQLKQAQATIENMASYREPKYDAFPHPEQLPLTFEQSVVFDNVTFSFPGATKPTLRGINLQVQKGEKIGFIGSSGSGKTTLMNVLLRFYTEQEGHILIDGQPLTAQHERAWHNIIGYVKQDTFLMETTIQDNITLGDTEVDAARLEYAIEQSSLRAFVSGLPEGVHTRIGERGSKLSGGQRQRIGIARALYKQTQLLVLDEATSALDNETEREVNEAINKLSATNITIFIIAHRITTLRECDRIYELSDGKIIAQHQYENLIQRAQAKNVAVR